MQEKKEGESAGAYNLDRSSAMNQVGKSKGLVTSQLAAKRARGGS